MENMLVIPIYLSKKFRSFVLVSLRSSNRREARNRYLQFYQKMIVKKENINFRKHILIIGKSELERHKYLNEILLNSDLQTVRFPRAMKSFEEYIQTVINKKLYFPYFPSKGNYNSDQIFDYHFDWLKENKTLIVFEEFQHMEERWKLELLRLFFNNLESNKKSSTMIVFSMSEENGIIEKLSELIFETEYKTKKQIIESNLVVIEI